MRHTEAPFPSAWLGSAVFFPARNSSLSFVQAVTSTAIWNEVLLCAAVCFPKARAPIHWNTFCQLHVTRTTTYVNVCCVSPARVRPTGPPNRRGERVPRVIVKNCEQKFTHLDIFCLWERIGEPTGRQLFFSFRSVCLSTLGLPNRQPKTASAFQRNYCWRRIRQPRS